jgi:hypothetical protein
MDFLELLVRPLFWVARGLLWLAWEVWDSMFLLITWSIGWPIVRLLSFGKFPHVRFGGYDDSSTGEAFIVCGVGTIVLGAVTWLSASHLGW